MTGRKLPPLLVGGCYKGPPLASIAFTPPALEREMKGETTAVLRLTLANQITLAFPVRAFQLQMLMGSLMRIFPQQAMANLRLAEERQDWRNGPGRSSGARNS